jgi:hypothetical protein
VQVGGAAHSTAGKAPRRPATRTSLESSGYGVGLSLATTQLGAGRRCRRSWRCRDGMPAGASGTDVGGTCSGMLVSWRHRRSADTRGTSMPFPFMPSGFAFAGAFLAATLALFGLTFWAVDPSIGGLEIHGSGDRRPSSGLGLRESVRISPAVGRGAGRDGCASPRYADGRGSDPAAGRAARARRLTRAAAARRVLA